jgi:hypothetical protein
VNGVALPGLTTVYARADHTHPTDTTRLPTTGDPVLTGTTQAAAVSVTGDVAIAGIIAALGKGHLLGAISGDATAAISKADANILLHDGGGDNWAGIGIDASGKVFIRVGQTGTPAAAVYVDTSSATTFLKSPVVPTPANTDSSTKFATTKFVKANPASGPYLPAGGGTVTGDVRVNGYIRSWRGAGETGVIYLSTPGVGTKYLYYNGADFYLNGQSAYSSNGRLLGNSDFATPIRDIRFAYLADRTRGSTQGLEEPYGGGVITGMSAMASARWDETLGYYNHFRYRQFQALTTSWWAVSYA